MHTKLNEDGRRDWKRSRKNDFEQGREAKAKAQDGRLRLKRRTEG